jgi:hypothetical protein
MLTGPCIRSRSLVVHRNDPLKWDAFLAFLNGSVVNTSYVTLLPEKETLADLFSPGAVQ